jgi:hypothetical protein
MGRRRSRLQRLSAQGPQAAVEPIGEPPAPRSRPTEANADRGSRKRRLAQVGLGATLLAAALIPLIAVTMQSEDTSRRPANRVVEHEVAGLLAGIPQQGDALGRPSAPVTLRVYSDLECLTARGWWVDLLPAIIKRFVRGGTVRIEFRSFKTDTHDPATFLRQQADALAAGEQNKMWDFVGTFYYEQGKEYTPYATERYIEGIAAQVPGLRPARWHRDRQSGRLTEQVVTDDKQVRELGFHDTPAFTIGRTGGSMKKLTGRHIVLQFAGYARMRNPVSLIDTQDLQKAIEGLSS